MGEELPDGTYQSYFTICEECGKDAPCNMQGDILSEHKKGCIPLEYDFEMDSDPKGETLCGKLRRKHKMKRYNWSRTSCVYPGCNGLC